MELKTFIKEALNDIIGAVEEVQSSNLKGKIVPSDYAGVNAAKAGDLGILKTQPIEFEIMVSINEKEGSEAKLNVVAAIIGGHIKGESNSSLENVSKLKFKIPIKLPSS